MARLTDEDRAQIIARFHDGHSQHSIAKQLGCAVSSVNRTIKAAGLERSAPKNEQRSTDAATAAHVGYSRERRRALVGRALDKAEQLLEGITTPRDLQFLLTAVGIGIDKLALLDESSETKGGEILTLIQQMRADVQSADGETVPLDSGE